MPAPSFASRRRHRHASAAAAALLALTSVPHVIASVKNPADATDSEKRAGRSILLRNVALLGATVLAAQDTQGKPGLTWRAEDTSHRIGRAAEKKAKALSRDAEKASRNGQKLCGLKKPSSPAPSETSASS